MKCMTEYSNLSTDQEMAQSLSTSLILFFASFALLFGNRDFIQQILRVYGKLTTMIR